MITTVRYGLHWAPHEYFVGDQMDVWIDRMKSMGMSLVVTLNKDLYSFEKFRNAGMDVIFRPQMTCEDIYQDVSGTYAMVQAFPPGKRKVQPYNEPSDIREWPNGKPDNYVETWSNRWIDAALKIYHAGGEPGIQCLDPINEFVPLLNRIHETGNDFLLDNTWVSIHNYPNNHDPLFPVLARDGYDEYTKAGITSFWAPVLQFDKAWRETTGRPSTDIYGTEGLWTVGDDDDTRFLKVTPELHRDYTLTVVSAFKKGQFPNAMPWPSYFKGFVGWLIASTAMQGDFGFDANAWYYSQIRDPHSTLTLTIDALATLAQGKPITLEIDNGGPPVPPVPPVPQDSLTRVLHDMWKRQGVTVALDNGFFVKAVEEARTNKVYIVPQPSPDGNFEADVDGYRIAYTMPPMYAKIGDWGNVKVGLPF